MQTNSERKINHGRANPGKQPNDAVINSPLTYWPDDSGGEVKDDFIQYTTRQFTTLGIICGCNPNKVYHNKASFKAQHCKTVRHKRWLTTLTQAMPGILKKANEARSTLKELRVIEGKTRQENIRLRKTINLQTDKLITMETKLEEAKEETKNWEELVEQQQESAKGFQSKIKMLEERIKTLEQKNKQIKTLWKTMGEEFGYEISDSDNEE